MAAEKTADDAAAKPAAKRAAAKVDAHAEQLAHHLELAGKHAEGLVGIELISHALDVAFIHALRGARDEAELAIAAAQAECDKYAPNLQHIERQIALLFARAHAALAGKA